MSAADFCRDAVEKYGRSGDGSLEYIGLILSGDRLIEKRVYRKNCGALLEELRRAEPYRFLLESVFADLLRIRGIALCDVSCNGSRPFPLYRIVFRLPGGMSDSETDEVLAAFFRHLENGDGYRERLKEELRARPGGSCGLMQIGAEFDGRGGWNGLKYYRFLDKENVLLRTLGSGREDRIRTVCGHGYEPAFLGVNDTGSRRERKLYFISTAIGFKNAGMLERTLSAAGILGWDRAVSKEEFGQLDDLGVYAEGIAMSLQEPEIWRLYYREYLTGRKRIGT